MVRLIVGVPVHPRGSRQSGVLHLHPAGKGVHHRDVVHRIAVGADDNLYSDEVAYREVVHIHVVAIPIQPVTFDVESALVGFDQVIADQPSAGRDHIKCALAAGGDLDRLVRVADLQRRRLLVGEWDRLAVADFDRPCKLR